MPYRDGSGLSGDYADAVALADPVTLVFGRGSDELAEVARAQNPWGRPRGGKTKLPAAA